MARDEDQDDKPYEILNKKIDALRPRTFPLIQGNVLANLRILYGVYCLHKLCTPTMDDKDVYGFSLI